MFLQKFPVTTKTYLAFIQCETFCPILWYTTEKNTLSQYISKDTRSSVRPTQKKCQHQTRIKHENIEKTWTTGN